MVKCLPSCIVRAHRREFDGRNAQKNSNGTDPSRVIVYKLDVLAEMYESLGTLFLSKCFR